MQSSGVAHEKMTKNEALKILGVGKKDQENHEKILKVGSDLDILTIS